jgi:hypothetical protein
MSAAGARPGGALLLALLGCRGAPRFDEGAAGRAGALAPDGARTAAAAEAASGRRTDP